MVDNLTKDVDGIADGASCSMKHGDELPADLNMSQGHGMRIDYAQYNGRQCPP